jgi:hypothetical protein
MGGFAQRSVTVSISLLRGHLLEHDLRRMAKRCNP